MERAIQQGTAGIAQVRNEFVSSLMVGQIVFPPVTPQLLVLRHGNRADECLRTIRGNVHNWELTKIIVGKKPPVLLVNLDGAVCNPVSATYDRHDKLQLGCKFITIRIDRVNGESLNRRLNNILSKQFCRDRAQVPG